MMVVNKKVKSLVTVVLWIFAILSLGYVLLQILGPVDYKVEREVYNASVESGIDYSVRLKHTPIYNAAVDAEPSKFYVVPFTDYIMLDCSYAVNASNQSEVNANSYVNAYLVSYIDDREEEVVLWKKEYILADEESEQNTDTNVSGQRKVKVDLAPYMDLINQVEEDYDYRTRYYLMVVYTTELNIASTAAQETKVLQPSIRFNLEDMLFEVVDNSSASASIKATEWQQIEGKVNWDMVIIGSTMFLIFALAAIIIPTRMQGRLPLSDEAKANRQVRMKYGDRIVNILTKPVISENTVRVESIEDVTKIADEIGQPIFCAAIDKETYYYVNNSGVIYYISMKTE